MAPRVWSVLLGPVPVAKTTTLTGRRVTQRGEAEEHRDIEKHERDDDTRRGLVPGSHGTAIDADAERYPFIGTARDAGRDLEAGTPAQAFEVGGFGGGFSTSSVAAKRFGGVDRVVMNA
jgi:hypothetical protein